MKKFLISLTIVVFFLGMIHACGGGNGGDGGGTGTVALFFTDDLADYRHVIGTITSVRLFHTGTSASCRIVSEPLTYDFTDLADVLQLVRKAQCDAVPYNRLELVFEEAVSLTDAAGTSADCTFVSYKDESNHINRLSCSNGSCTLTVNGAVNVLANHEHAIALDFDLKEFEVQPEPLVAGESCTVTMKVSPIHSVDMDDMHNAAISGFIVMDSLDTMAGTFEIVKHDISYTVDFDYSDAAAYNRLEGTLENGASVKVNLYGFDGANNLAHEVEVEDESHIETEEY